MEATAEKIKNSKFILDKFYYDYYFTNRKGTGYVIGTADEYENLRRKRQSWLMPFIVIRKVGTNRVKVICRPSSVIYLDPTRKTTKSFIQGYTRLGDYDVQKLPNSDELTKIRPDFCLKKLTAYAYRSHRALEEDIGVDDIYFPPDIDFNKVKTFTDPFMTFASTNKKYDDWLKVDYNILYDISQVDLPGSLSACEKLFDKNVLEIKKIVNDIGDVQKIISKETKNFILYDDSNFILDTSLTELNKSVQAYGFISIFYNNKTNKLITSKNTLKFNVLHDTEREFLTLQLEDIISPHKIETVNFKITNLCMTVAWQ